MHRTRGFLTLLPLHGRGQPGRLVRACDTTQGNGCLLARDEDRMPLEVESRACGPLVHGVPHKSPCSVAQHRLVCLRHGEASGHDVLPLATLHAPWRVTSYRPPLQIPLLTYNALRPGFTAYCGSRLTALETVLH